MNTTRPAAVQPQQYIGQYSCWCAAVAVHIVFTGQAVLQHEHHQACGSAAVPLQQYIWQYSCAAVAGM
jgi:hypothetical protein